MVNKSIKDINPKKLKKAQKMFALLELVGITEKDFELLQKLPEIIEDVKDLKQFKDTQIATQINENNRKVGQIQANLRKHFSKKVEEFDPNGKQA